MKKHSSFGRDSVGKFYILTRPSKLSDLSLDELEQDEAADWREKSRQLQARRWRKLKHQLI